MIKVRYSLGTLRMRRWCGDSWRRVRRSYRWLTICRGIIRLILTWRTMITNLPLMAKSFISWTSINFVMRRCCEKLSTRPQYTLECLQTTKLFSLICSRTTRSAKLACVEMEPTTAQLSSKRTQDWAYPMLKLQSQLLLPAKCTISQAWLPG